jgi:antitoxin ParD1/3/4
LRYSHTITVSLTPEQERFIAEGVRRGDYSSPEGMLSEGLKLIQAKEEYQERLARLRDEIDVGIEQATRAELLDGRDVIEKIKTRNAQRPR